MANTIIAIIIQILTFIGIEYLMVNAIGAELRFRVFYLTLAVLYLIPADIIGYEIALERRKSKSSLTDVLDLFSQLVSNDLNLFIKMLVIIVVSSLGVLVGYRLIFDNQFYFGVLFLILGPVGSLFLYLNLRKILAAIKSGKSQT